MTDRNPPVYQSGSRSGTSPTIVAGSAIGAIAGGIPGAILGGIIGAVIDELTSRCPRCNHQLTLVDRKNRIWQCYRCGFVRKD